MVTIAKVSDNIGEYIGERAGLQTETKKICYGVECLLVILLSISVLLIVGWLCGVFTEMALITLAAFIMKHIIGGPHLSGFSRCTGFSALMFVSTAWLLKAINYFPLGWVIALALLGNAIVLYYGPLFAPEFPFSKEQVRTRKILGVLLIIFLTIFNVLRPNLYFSALFSGVLLQVMFTTPRGVLIIQCVEKITKGKEAQSA